MSPATPAAGGGGSELLDGRAGFAAGAAQVAAAARHRLSVLSEGLDAALYGAAEFVAAVKAFVLTHPQARVRVLLAQGRSAARGPHALVELGRTLTSRIEFRELPEHRRGEVLEQLIADDRVLLERRKPEDLESRLHRDDPSRARQAERHYDALWDESLPCAELRRLSL